MNSSEIPTIILVIKEKDDLYKIKYSDNNEFIYDINDFCIIQSTITKLNGIFHSPKYIYLLYNLMNMNKSNLKEKLFVDIKGFGTNLYINQLFEIKYDNDSKIYCKFSPQFYGFKKEINYNLFLDLIPLNLIKYIERDIDALLPDYIKINIDITNNIKYFNSIDYRKNGNYEKLDKSDLYNFCFLYYDMISYIEKSNINKIIKKELIYNNFGSNEYNKKDYSKFKLLAKLIFTEIHHDLNLYPKIILKNQNIFIPFIYDQASSSIKSVYKKINDDVLAIYLPSIDTIKDISSSILIKKSNK